MIPAGISLISEVVESDGVNSKITTIEIEMRQLKNAFFHFVILNPNTVNESIFFKRIRLETPSKINAMT